MGALRREIETIRERCIRSLSYEYNEASSTQATRLVAVPPIPPLVNLLLGDAVHNLRSALDHLAWHRAPTCRSPTPHRRRPARHVAPLDVRRRRALAARAIPGARSHARPSRPVRQPDRATDGRDRHRGSWSRPERVSTV